MSADWVRRVSGELIDLAAARRGVVMVNGSVRQRAAMPTGGVARIVAVAAPARTPPMACPARAGRGLTLIIVGTRS